MTGTSVGGAATVVPPVGTVVPALEMVRSSSRRTHASNAHSAGTWAGATGVLVASRFAPTAASRLGTVLGTGAGAARAVGATSAAGATASSVVTGAAWTAAAIVVTAAGGTVSLAAERRSSVRCRSESTRPSTATTLPVGTGAPNAVTGAAARDSCPDAGPDPSEGAVGSAVLAAAAGAGPCWLSVDSDVVGVDSAGAGTGAGALTASDAVAALTVVSVASADVVSPVRSGAAVVSALSDVAKLVWAPPLLTTTSLAVAGDAGSDDVDVVPDGDPDADITGLVDAPADACVDADAEDSIEPEEPDVESDPDDADDDPEEDFVLDGDPDADIAELVDAPADGCVDFDGEDSTEPEEPDVESDPDDVDELVDDDPEGEDEQLESDVSARATPCPVTTAAPTPKATASPPTRPTYAAALIRFSFSARLRGWYKPDRGYSSR